MLCFVSSEDSSKCVLHRFKAETFPILGILFVAQICDIIYAYLSLHLLVAKLFRLIYVQNIEAATVSEKNTDAATFHRRTQQSNRMILSVSRLAILLSVAIASSQTAVILLLVAPHFVFCIYSVDCAVNMYCLWLNFNFATKYYQTWFCGTQCMKNCFPLIKTLALTCEGCSDGERNGCAQCGICCCYCCSHCCNEKERRRQRDIYAMSREETELMTL